MKVGDFFISSFKKEIENNNIKNYINQLITKTNEQYPKKFFLKCGKTRCGEKDIVGGKNAI